MDAFEFDGKKYRAASGHQKEWGRDLIAKLSLKGNESILDLGCGDGVLTEQLSLLAPRGKTVGIDASENMIDTAKTLIGENLLFAQMDMNAMRFENEFDLIFSNAALHWVKDHRGLLRKAYRALKQNGEIRWEFGGAGNCANFCGTVREKMREEPYKKYFADFEWPWFMPSKAQYTELISKAGFSDYAVKEVNRDRHFSDASEMIKWIDQPSLVPFIKHIPDQLKELFRRDVIEEMLKKTRQTDGACFETFRRIRVYARK